MMPFNSYSTGIKRRMWLWKRSIFLDHFDGLVQERCNSSALAMELHLSCTNPSICKSDVFNWSVACRSCFPPENFQLTIQYTKGWFNLRAKFFRGNIKHVFTFYVIPPHWHAKDNWNPSPYKTRTYLFYIVNIMVADVLATQGARASATMILT